MLQLRSNIFVVHKAWLKHANLNSNSSLSARPLRSTYRMVGLFVGHVVQKSENSWPCLKPQDLHRSLGQSLTASYRELTYPIKMDSKVIPISMEDPDGMLIYRRSLTFLLEAAFEEKFPEASLTIDHSVSSGGYYCEVTDHSALTDEQLADLTTHMRSIVKEIFPLRSVKCPWHKQLPILKLKDIWIRYAC